MTENITFLKIVDDSHYINVNQIIGLYVDQIAGCRNNVHFENYRVVAKIAQERDMSVVVLQTFDDKNDATKYLNDVLQQIGCKILQLPCAHAQD